MSKPLPVLDVVLCFGLASALAGDRLARATVSPRRLTPK